MGRFQRRTEIGVHMATPKSSKGFEILRFLLLSPNYPEVQRTTKATTDWNSWGVILDRVMQTQDHIMLGKRDELLRQDNKSRAFALIEIEVILKVSKYPRRLVIMDFLKALISQFLISDKYWQFLNAKRYK